MIKTYTTKRLYSIIFSTITDCYNWFFTRPWPGEKSVVAISNGAKNYTVKSFGGVGFYHDGDVADFNGDGNMDILLLNQNKSKKAEVYLNNGNGKFAKSNKYFSQFASFKGAYMHP